MAVASAAALKPRRPLRLSYLAPLPEKLTTKTRVRFTSQDGEVLFAVAEELGRLYRQSLAVRVKAGKSFDGKADFAALQRDLTREIPARYGGTIALAVRQEYALAKRNAYAHRQRLRTKLHETKQQEEVIELQRQSLPLPERLEKVSVRKGLTLDSVRRRLCSLESKLKRIEDGLATGQLSVCKGTSKLLKTRLYLNESDYDNISDWRQEWEAERLYLGAYGDKRSAWGNQMISVDPQGVCEIALPKAARFKKYDNTGRGRYRLDASISFSYRNAEHQAALASGRAIYYEFSYDPRVGRKRKKGSEGRWYLSTAIDYPEFELPLAQSLAEARSQGVVAIDLNHELLACRYVDASGNPASRSYDIALDWTDTHSKERLTLLGQELTKLCQWAAAKDARALAIEDLNFSDLKDVKRNKTTNRKLHGIPTATFRHLLVSIAAKHGLRVIACDPAYTSIDGKAFWSDCGPKRTKFKLSRHQAAAITIGRRSLAMALRRQSQHPTRGSKLGPPGTTGDLGAGRNGISRSDYLEDQANRTKPPPLPRRTDDSAEPDSTRGTTGPRRARRSSRSGEGDLKLA